MGLKENQLKLLYELSINSRQSKTKLGRKLHMSPQLVKYNIDQLRSCGLFNEELIIDLAKFNLINIKIILNFISFEGTAQSEVMEFLYDCDYIVVIEELSLGADLMIEYAVPNLSFFNKLHSIFLENFNKVVEVTEIYPIFVKYKFPKKYLHKNAEPGVKKILCGDRLPEMLKSKEQRILRELTSNPTISIVKLANNLNINIKTVIQLIKTLENREIIIGYSIKLNYRELGISVCNLIIKFNFITAGEIQRLIAFSQIKPEITSIIKLMGKESILLRIESLGTYNKVLNELRKEFKIHNYTVYDGGNIIKNTYVPLSLLSVI